MPELINHSDELKAAFLPLTQSDTQAANDNEPDYLMSWIAVREVWKLDLPSTEKFVLLAIADFSNDKKGIAWPSQSTIAGKTGYSRQTVNRVIKRLCARGVLVSSRRSAEGKSTSNVYRINIVALRDIQTNNVAQNDNQLSNSETNQCKG